MMAGFLASLLLAACGGGNIAGNGNKPESIVIELVGTSIQKSPGVIYQCELGQLRALMYFTDGSVGDFTRRVTWSANGSGTATISNGDVPVDPSDLTQGYYTHGALIPGASGEATISAEYNGLVGRFALTVLSPDANTIQIVNGVSGSEGYLKPVPVQGGSGTFWMGSGTSQVLKVVGSLGGAVTDLSAYVRWSFDFGGDPSELVASSSGVVSALRAGAAQTLRATLPGCSTQLTLPVAVSDIRALSVTPQLQEPDTSPSPLVVGNNERLQVTAQLAAQDGSGNPIQQDVSGAVNLWISNPAVLGQSTSGNGATIISAIAPGGPVTLQASQSFANQAEVQSPYVQISAVSGTLDSLTVNPPSATALAGLPAGCQLSDGVLPVLKTGSICFSPFTATGSFVLADGSTRMQDITRIASWSLSDATIATIASGLLTGGWVLAPTVQTPGVETVTATVPGIGSDTSGTGLLQLR
jgi:hypothetical protein